MSEATEEVKLHIKVVINKEKTKVLFAEAGSDFTDVLLSFLLFPLGKIMEVLEKHYGDKAPVLGSLNTLYNGVANLDIIHFSSSVRKRYLLDPPSCYHRRSRKLRLNVSCTQPTSSTSGEPYDGVFTHSAASFIISDDLRVLPNVSIMKTLSTLGIAVADMDGTETRNVAFGLNEMMTLLKESLISLNPLTTLVFPQSRVNLAAEGHILLHQIDQEVISMNPKKVILEVILQKSTNKLLFAQADYDFVDFLFSVLTVSLGNVVWFLGSNTGLKNMDNLHRSIADNYNKMHLVSSDIKDLLIKPAPDECYHSDSTTSNEFCCLNFTSRPHRSYVEGMRMYMITDDLTVAPLDITSSLSVLNELKISLSDVEELELQVGLEEGLSIMKAALTSPTALTDGLIKPFLKKKAHQEMEQQIGVEKVSNSASSDGVVNKNSKKRPKVEC